jgi:hypothetical protein
MYRPYMSASALSDVVDRHEKLAAKGHLLHEHIRSNIAPVLQTRAMNARPSNRWNPTNGKMSLLKRTTGNIFFDYVRVAVVSLIVQFSHPLPSDLSCSIRRLGTVCTVSAYSQNNVESVLLFCAVLVAIAGIMFNSGELSSGANSADGQVCRSWGAHLLAVPTSFP